jgi:hypothetical protein
MEGFEVPVERWPRSGAGRPVSVGVEGATRSIRVRITSDLDDRLTRYAQRKGANRSEVVRALLEDALDSAGA